MAHVSGSRRALAATVFALILALPSLSQDAGLPPPEEGARERLNSSPRHGEWVSFDASRGGSPRDMLSAWIVYPERPDPAPIVIVVHEIFGLSDWVRAVADQLAAEGFIAIAPDLLSGKAPGGAGSRAVDADGARSLIAGLDPVEIARRLDATADYALALPAAATKFGIVGFCWGGGVSFDYATRRQDLGASVSFYGIAPPAQAIARINAPVLAFYGGSDERVTSTEAPAGMEFQRLGKHFEYGIYPGAGHAFMRQQGGQNGANLEAAKESWPRMLAFLKAELAGSEAGAAPASRSALALDEDGCDGSCCSPPQAAGLAQAASLPQAASLAQAEPTSPGLR